MGLERPDLAAEYRGIDLGDARLSGRLEKIVSRLSRAPAAGFPTALVTEAECEAFYRFISNPKVDLDGVLAPHKARTRERCDTAGEVLVAIDKSDMAFKGETREDLDALSATTQGFSAFFALAMTRDRTPLGVLDILPLQQGKRGRSTAQTWNESAARALEGVGSETRVIVLMDREADAFEVVAALAAEGHSFVIRAKYDRLLEDGSGLLSVIAAEPRLLEREVELSRRNTKHKPPAARARHPSRKGRVARLSVRACTVTIPCPPKQRASGLPSGLDVNVIHVVEPKPPTGEVAVDWLLLTHESIETPQDVERAIDAYRARWVIEEYFKALKTGCAYEDRQLEGRKTLLVGLGILAPIAWQLLLLRSTARARPELPADRVLTRRQIMLLQRSEDTKLCDAPTAAQALLAVARLGGHLRQNGPPGWLVLWRGFEKLRTWEAGYLLARRAR